jgi:DNA-directed RNA polymerase subunit alpha
LIYYDLIGSYARTWTEEIGNWTGDGWKALAGSTFKPLSRQAQDSANYPGREQVVTRIPLNHFAGQAKDLKERLEMSTAEIGLTVRTTNCLEEKGIFTVNDLLHSTREDLLSISNFGEKTLEEVYLALERIGFYRKTKRETVGV